jgi:glycosyltransferase involved in cell wall biosynthesis
MDSDIRSYPAELREICRCRIYLFTYRRPGLLKKAVESLIKQTYSHWVCEVHNDDPTDLRPTQVLAEFGDSRLTLVTHAENLGPTKTFNCAFAPVAEEFISILEDDNTWDPEFLSSCIAHLDERPDVSLVWANMQMWRQTDDTTCVPTDVTFWPQRTSTGEALPATTTFHWPNARSLIGELHSTGAMVVRSRDAPDYIIPDECPSNYMEHVRERTFRYPIVLIRQKLANWTWTTTTSRPSGGASSLAMQVMLAGSFLLHSEKTRYQLMRIWIDARRRRPRQLVILFLVILLNMRLWRLIRYFKVADFGWLCVDFGKHPLLTLTSLLHVRRLAILNTFLKDKTEKLFIRSRRTPASVSSVTANT